MMRAIIVVMMSVLLEASAVAAGPKDHAAAGIQVVDDANGMAGASAAMSGNNGPTLYDAMGGAGQTGSSRMAGPGGVKLEGGFFSWMTITPSISLDQPNNGVVATLSGFLSGMASDPVAVTSVTVVFQRKDAGLDTGDYYDWGSEVFSPGVAQSSVAVLTAGQYSQSTGWQVSMPDSALVDFTRYYIRATVVNTSSATTVVESTFVFNASMLDTPPGDGEGRADLSSSSLMGCQPVTSTIAFTVGPSGMAFGARIALRIPNGWSRPGGWSDTASHPLPLPPSGTVYVESPVAYSLVLNPQQSDNSLLGDNWVLFSPSAPLAPGQKVYFVYTGFPPTGPLAGQKHRFAVLSKGVAAGNLVAITTSPVMVPLTAGPPRRLAFSPADPISLGPLQSAPTMQVVLMDGCGSLSQAGAPFDVTLEAGRPGDLDRHATFYASAAGKILVTSFGAGASVATPAFYFQTSTAGIDYEMLMATATIPGFGKTGAYKFVKLFANSVKVTGVSVDTGTFTGARTATMTGSGFDSPAFINFSLNEPAARWEVVVSPDPADFDPPVFQRFGTGSPGRGVAWNWINEKTYPASAVPPGEYFVRIRVEGGVVEDATTRLYVDQSASLLGSVGALGAGAYVYASGPGANYGNFSRADAAGDFRVYGLENGKAYNLTASTQLKTVAGEFLTLSVSSVNVTASNAGKSVGSIPFPVPGYIRASVKLPLAAPRELVGLVKARNEDATVSAIGTIHFSTSQVDSDNGGAGFGGNASSWTVLGLPAGTYDLDVEVSGLRLSTRVEGVTVSPGAMTDLKPTLPRKANVYGLAVLPSTSTFGTWVSVQATAWGEKYPAAFGGTLVPGVSPGVNPTSATFALYGLDPGSWTLRALAQGFVAAASTVLVEGDTDIGDHLPGSFDLALSSAGVILGTVTVRGDSRSVPSQKDDPADTFSVFVNAYNPATFSRASARVRVPRHASVTSSTFGIAGLENGSWVLTSQVQGFSDGRQAVPVADGRGLADLRMAANDARLHAEVILPGGPWDPPEYRKVSILVRSPQNGAVMLGDMTAGSTVQYTPTSAVWLSSPMAPGHYILEAGYDRTGMQRKVEVALTDKATAYVTLDLTGPTYAVRGAVSLVGNVQFSSANFGVSVSSIAGLLNAAPATSYCLLGSAAGQSISAAHMELLPVDMKTGRFLDGSLQSSSGGAVGCGRVELEAGLSMDAPSPVRGYVAPIAANGSFVFPGVPPGSYVLRNNAELDLDLSNGNEMPRIQRIFQVSASTTLAVFKIDAGASLSGTVFLPPGTLMSRMVEVELLDSAGSSVRRSVAGFNNSDVAPYFFEKLPEGSYSVQVRDLGFPKAFGAMPLSAKLSGGNLSGQDIRLKRTGVVKGKIALQSRLPYGTTGPFLLVSNKSLDLLPNGFKIEAKANPWFQGGRQVARARLCGTGGCSLPELDANDQFTIEDLLPGTYELKLWSYNSAENLRNGGVALVPMALPSVKVEEGRLTDVGTVNILSAVRLAGTVRAAGGAPLSNIRVVARASKREGGRDTEAESYALTDQDGAYTLYGIDPVVRYYDVYAAMRPNPETEGTYLPPYEQTIIPSVDVSCTTTLDFALAAAPYAISGRVSAAGGPGLSTQFDQGQIVPGARVMIQKDGVIPTMNPVADIELYTDAEGIFEAPALTAGTYKVMVASLGYGSRSMLVTLDNESVDLGSIPLALGGSMAGSIKKPDGSSPSQDEVQMVVAANADMSDIVFGTLVKDETSRTVGEYSISGFKPGVAYTLILVDGRENLVTPREARTVVFVSSSECRGLDLVYRAPKPKVFAKARRAGSRFKVEMSMTQPLRQKKALDDDYAAILTTYSAAGALSDFELSNDRTKLSAVYAPGVAESSFTLRLAGRSSVADPDSLDSEDPEFELATVATFYAGIDGMHQNQVGNIWGGNLIIEGDQGRLTLPGGAFAADVSSNVQISLNISSESLSRFGVSGMGAGRAKRFAASAYPAELMRAMDAVPPQVSPFSAFYNVMLPLGLRTTLSRPAQLTVTYSS
ncbi:MAG: hypothetical protein WC943_01275, partial [Elusimicrobiota bacterium]